MLCEPMVLCGNGHGGTVTCQHMLAAPPEIPQEGPVVSFMNRLAGEGFFDRAKHFTGVDSVVDFYCFQPLTRFPEVAEVESERSLATNLLLRFVRNIFVHNAGAEGEKWFQQHPQNEIMICCMISVLEQLETCSDWGAVRRKANKRGFELAGGNRRDVVKFVAKRLPCTCLKELHRAARKKLVKEGVCRGCNMKFPRSELFICTGCTLTLYCSRECQRTDWSRHKKYCGDLITKMRTNSTDRHLVN